MVNDTRGALLVRIVILSSLAYSGLFTMPLWVGGLADELGLGSAELGYMASAQLACSMLSGLLLSTGRISLPLKHLLVVGIGMVLSANFLCAYSVVPAQLLALRGLSGLGEGILLAGLNIAISRTAKPDVLFAVSQTSVGVFGIVLFAVVPVLIGRYGVSALFLSVCALAVCALLVVIFLQPGADTDRPLTDTVAGPAVAGLRAYLLPLVSLAVVFVGCQGAWSYMERMGVQQQLELEVIGRYLVVGQVISLLAPALATKAAGLMDRRLAIVLGLSISGSAVVCASQAGPAFWFLIAAGSFQFGTLFIVTSYYGFLAELDCSGRAVAAAPAFLNFGSALGPAVIGSVLGGAGAEGSTFAPLAVAVIVCYVLAGLGLLCYRFGSLPKAPNSADSG